MITKNVIQAGGGKQMIPKTTPMEKGLISVLMSNYNTPVPYLKEAIDSVLAQTYTDFEFIIIDDGSTDDSPAFIESYSDPRIRLITNEQNMGLARSLNIGLALCHGEFIARMDSDDVCYPERFTEQAAFLKENPDTIVCGTCVEFIDDKGEVTSLSDFNTLIPDMDYYKICLLFSNNPTVFHPGAMFNRKLLLQYNITYDEAYRYAQDYRMWVTCSEYAKITNIQKYLMKYRNHSEAISSAKYEEQCRCAYRIIQQQLDPLHLTLTEEIIPYHFKFLYLFTGYSVKMKEWIRQIIKANKKYKIYHQKKLKRLLWDRFAHTCIYAMKQSDSKTRRYILRTMSFRAVIGILRIFILRLVNGKNGIYNHYEGTIKRKR